MDNKEKKKGGFLGLFQGSGKKEEKKQTKKDSISKEGRLKDPEIDLEKAIGNKESDVKVSSQSGKKETGKKQSVIKNAPEQNSADVQQSKIDAVTIQPKEGKIK